MAHDVRIKRKKRFRVSLDYRGINARTSVRKQVQGVSYLANILFVVVTTK